MPLLTLGFDVALDNPLMGNGGVEGVPAPAEAFPAPLEDTRTLLSVEGLSVTFSHRRQTVSAVRDVSFNVKRGETIAIIGESGSGKSVTARAIMGLLPKETARITGSAKYENNELIGTSARELRSRRGKDLAYVFQDASRSLNPTMKVGQQLVEAIKAHNEFPKARLRALAVEYLNRVQIPAAAHRFHQYPHELSGGMRQRVMIAIALSCQPRLVIADEPTTALDVTTQAQIMELLQDLQQEYGLTVVLISHDMGIAASFSNRVAVMYAGRIVEEGPTSSIFSGARMPYSRALLESIPSLDLDPFEPLTAIKGQPPSPSSPISGCAFSPRCQFASSMCFETAPIETDDGKGHRWSCWNPLGVEK